MGKNIEEVDFDRYHDASIPAWDVFKRGGIFELRGADGFIGNYNRLVFGWDPKTYSATDRSFYLTIGYVEEDADISDLLDYFDVPEKFFKDYLPGEKIDYELDVNIHEIFCQPHEALAQTMARVATALVAAGLIWNPLLDYRPD